MKVTLKNVKHNKALSQETNCFSADVWVDGIKRGTAANPGQGTPHEVHPRKLLEELEAHARTLPPVTVKSAHPSMNGFTYQPGYEHVIDEAFVVAMEGKRIARLMKTKTLFIDGGKAWTSPARPSKPVDKILNDMPFDDAVAAWVAATAG